MVGAILILQSGVPVRVIHVNVEADTHAIELADIPKNGLIKNGNGSCKNANIFCPFPNNANLYKAPEENSAQ